MLDLAMEFATKGEDASTELQSGLRCSIAFQLAMGAGMTGRWADAVEWLELSLSIKRGLHDEKRPRAETMLREARGRVPAGAKPKKMASRSAKRPPPPPPPLPPPPPPPPIKAKRRKTPTAYEL